MAEVRFTPFSIGLGMAQASLTLPSLAREAMIEGLDTRLSTCRNGVEKIDCMGFVKLEVYQRWWLNGHSG